MTIKKLMGLSREELLQMAKKQGLRISPEFSREVILKFLIDALNEDIQERDYSNSPDVKIEELKYHLSQNNISLDSIFENFQDEEIEIPQFYNENRIYFILRDPYWAFAFWNLKSDEIREYRKMSNYKGLILRVNELGPAGPSIGEEQDHFDIPIQFRERKWYINLPACGRNYVADILLKQSEKEILLCRSNYIQSPLIPEHEFLDDKKLELDDKEKRLRKLYSLSGAFETAASSASLSSGSLQSSPQRISEIDYL